LRGVGFGVVYRWWLAGQSLVAEAQKELKAADSRRRLVLMAEIIFSGQRLRQIIKRMRRLRILVVGDLMLDEFVWGKVSRISPEAPVPVVHVERQTFFPGGAANVARNLAELGVGVGVCGMRGDDANGEQLAGLLRGAKMDAKGLFVSRKFPTIVKTRIIARTQQVVRVDREEPLQFTSDDLKRIRAYLRRELPKYDAVIVEDYAKGFVVQEIFDELVGAGKNRPIVSVDPNPNNLLNFSGATVVKPNRVEAYAACAVRGVDNSARPLDEIGGDLLQRWGLPYLLVTLSEHGMKLYSPGVRPYHTPTKAREVFDVSGAGDTVIAFFTAALAAGVSGDEAAELANHAAGVVVSKLGTATVSAEELIASVSKK
jgi:D-beta-D-heptose 7-phosphate kinase/D-beta-D-heptose 1-phosphate adenosyltransferase